jgi:uncharacterized coiled-coil protein SlyX
MKKSIEWFGIIAVALTLSAWGGKYLKKLKLNKRYKAVYSCTINEDYTINKSEDSIAHKEEAISHINFNLNQEVLSKKKHQLKIDYLIQNYTRIDSLVIDNTIDTSSNEGQIPRVKNILFFTDKGQYLGAALQKKGPKLQTRDYKYFYRTTKQLIFHISDSSYGKQQWQTVRTDTILTSGFKLIFSYPLQWNIKLEKDTLEMHCMELTFKSQSVEYFATNSVMKALGIETYHKGVAAINGSVLIDKRTGRIIRYDEQGDFIGETEMKSPRVKEKWPSVYRYNKHFVLDKLIKKPREKFLGIF